MAGRKKTDDAPPFPDRTVERRFAHPDGRTYGLQVIDCRIHETWTTPGQRGASNVSTRDTEEDAQAGAGEKVRGLLKKGYVESEPRTGRRVADPTTDVIDVIRSELNFKGEPRHDLQAMPDRPNVYATINVSVAEWVITSDDRRLGILLRCELFHSKLPAAEREAMAPVLLDLLVDKRGEILADTKTAVRKFPLAAPVGRFSHLVVLSPAVVNHPPAALSRSVFRAFPAFDCEMRDVDTVTIAEGRTSGHGQLLSNWWNRKPHPVVDLAYLKAPTDEPKFLVYPPREMERRLGGTLEKLTVAEVRARNWRGDLRSFHKNQTPPDPAELRRFFGFDD